MSPSRIIVTTPDKGVLRGAHDEKIARVLEKSRKRPVNLMCFGGIQGSAMECEAKMHLYGLKTCDTCRKAIKALPDATFVDVRAQGVPADLLARAHAAFGARLVNTASTTWRGLSEDQRARDPLALLGDHPALMKRPLIVGDDGVLYLGWGKDVQALLA